MNGELDRLAEAHGIELGYKSEGGEWQVTPDGAKRKVLAALGVKAATDEGVAESLSALPHHDPSPATIGRGAFWPDWMVADRSFGLTCQLYSLRSHRNWGIGDFEDLAQLAEIVAPMGADFVGVSPLHALFTAEPHRISPYAPSSRAFLNPLFVAPDRVPGFEAVAHAMPELEGLRKSAHDSAHIDYPLVAATKLNVLTRLRERFLEDDGEHADQERDAFRNYCKSRGSALTRFCLYETLSEHMVREGGHAAWSTWPEAYRRINTPEVRSFARESKRRIEFHAWLQFVAERQLAEAQQRAQRAGMRVGLYLDLAVGVSPDGAVTWSNDPAVAPHARIGAPPDLFNSVGQNWGLVPLSPQAGDDSTQAFREVLRANMRNAGAVRIDHAMGLKRLYWIPEQDAATDGAYVRYPFGALLDALGDESWKCRCIVIGEDLGTLPHGFTDQIVQAGMLSYQVLYFTRTPDRFLPPDAYRREALCCVSTHDLATLHGWWLGRDIEWRIETGMATPEDGQRQRDERGIDRRHLLAALASAGLLPGEIAGAVEGRGPLPERLSDDVVIALHRYLARSPCRLFAIQIEDVLGLVEQANLPGTMDEHPNWRQKLPLPIEELAALPMLGRITAAAAEEGRRR